MKYDILFWRIILYDYHMHTSSSEDSNAPISAMIDAAIEKNITRIAITDHLDPFFLWDPFPYYLDLDAYKKSLDEAVLEYSDRIRIAKGIELGLQNGEALDVCEEVISGYDFDFVIASVHSTTTTPIDYKEFVEGRTVKEIIEEYYIELFESIKKYKNYDVLGHLNVIDRYYEGFAGADLYMPYIDEILKLAVYDGKGIEINTSSYRYGLGDVTHPPQIVIDRYVELGGEIVTIGSDAHFPKDVGFGIEKGEQMLLASGLIYVATYMNREPEFTKL